jgi:hypothetical protein
MTAILQNARILNGDCNATAAIDDKVAFAETAPTF